MKLINLCIVLLCASIIYSQGFNKSNFDSMVKTEYEFAARALQVGSRNAFLEFIADDGILFRPTPVNGKDFLLKQNSRPGFLIWYPSFAFISQSGDLGCTTGPAEFKRNLDSSSIWYGNFCTVWQLQKDGKWKFLIDRGISNNKPEEEIKKINYNPNSITNLSTELKEDNSDYKDLIFNIDKKFNDELNSNRSVEVYSKNVSEESRLLREGEQPIIGKTKILEYVSNISGIYSTKIIDGVISRSKDFGYVYGTVNFSGNNKTEKFNYIRMWKNESGNWKIIIELFSPLPE